MSLKAIIPFDKQIEAATNTFFEPNLRRFKLGRDQIEGQTLEQLLATLDRVNELMSEPSSFGTLHLKFGGAGLVVPRSANESQIELGVLPILVERKALILDRISALRPEAAITGLRKDILEQVDDPTARSEILRILDRHRAKQEDMSRSLQEESEQVVAAQETQAEAVLRAVAMTKIEGRIESMEGAIRRVEGLILTRWDVVLIVFAILGAIGGLVGGSLGVMKWLAGP